MPELFYDLALQNVGYKFEAQEENNIMSEVSDGTVRLV